MKRINKRIFFAFTLISSTFLPSLIINAKIETNIPGAETWIEDSGNISNGKKGFMFEDKKGNLWSAGNGTPLQKYDYGSSMWKTDNDIAGNLRYGLGGFMFQDKKGNLWSAGAGSPLQKYDYDNSKWETSDAIKGNLSNGNGGFMFQDKKGNLWSAGWGTALQKYDYGDDTWKTNTAIKGNISDGAGGFMFQDKKGNLWSVGNGTPLQKYDYYNSRWNVDAKISGNLSNGYGGFMFQDKKGNLWSAGVNAPLQKYDYYNSRWNSDAKISGNLSNGYGGFMFQDKKGNLWSAGWGTALQKYDYDNGKWETDKTIAGNLSDGDSGFMFQDKKGNLWSAGYWTPLQKYDYGSSTWISGEKINGNLSNGAGGFMFQDKKGNLWSVGNGTKLQVMYSDKYVVASVKTIIEAITGVKKTSNVDILPVVANPSFNAAALNSLGTGGTFPVDTRGTTLTYAHGGITRDGDLEVTVTITKGKAGATATFTVSVAGINVAKQNKIQEINLQALKTKLTGGAVTNDANKVGVIAAHINDAPSLKAETGIDLTGLVNSSTYAISASGDKDTGTITISVIMTTNGTTVPKSLPVTHNINHKSDATIDAEVQNNADAGSIKTIIEAITGVKKTSNVDILPVVANPSFNAVALNSLGTGGTFPGDTKGTTLTYAHGGITRDGDLEVTVTITKGKARATATFTVDVTGIDVAKQNEIQKANLQALKTHLTGGNVINDADKVGVIAAHINDAPSLKAETGIDLTGLVNSSTYAISASGDKDTGVITIGVIMTTNGATVPKSLPVTHNINHKSDATIDAEVQNNADSIKTIIEAITGVKKTSNVDILPVVANPSFNAVALNSLGTGGTFPVDTKGATLTYAHGGITSDGHLVVTVTITKGTATAFANFNIAVSGIDLAKTKVQKEANKFGDFSSTDNVNSRAAILSQKVEDVKAQFEAISSYKVPGLTDGYSISRVIVKTPLNTKTKKVVYTVTISDINSNIATKDIVVTFDVSKDGGLSRGEKAGITIGSILGVGIVGFLIYYYFKYFKKIKKTKIKH